MSLIDELKRRNVFKVSAAYLALSWVVTEVTGAVVPALHLPDSIPSIVVWLGVIGFPFVLVFSWVFELTPEGLKRESEVDRSQSITHVTSRRLDYIIIGLLVLALGLFAFERFSPRRDAPAQPAAVQFQTAPAATPAKAKPSVADVTPVDDKSIAVLPFINVSSDKEQEYFSDGLSEELLNLLAKVPQLQVTSRSSAFAFKGEKIDIPDVAAKLRVAHILEGSVRKSGNHVRITAQLIDARSDTHLWSETYDRTLDDIFVVQDEIAGAVVEQLKIKLLGDAPKTKVVKPQAYALFLQARQLSRQYTPAGYEQSIALYQQTLAIDPAYAEAWRGLAVTYSNQAIDGLRPGDEAQRMARDAVNKALEADPSYAAAYSTLGANALNFDRDFAAAAQHMQRALALDPADVNILGNATALLQNLGRLEQAIAVGEYLTAHDPVNTLVHVNLGGFYVGAGRPDAAIAALRTGLNLSPGYIDGQRFIGLALLQQGDKEAALAAMQQETGEAQRLCGVAVAQHALGHAAESDAALAELIVKFENSQPILIAEALAYRGDAERALAALDKAVASHNPGVSGISADPFLTALHSDPRWLPFLQKLGMAPEQLAAIKFDVKVPQ